MRYSENLGSSIDNITPNDSVHVKQTKELITKYNSLSIPGEKFSYEYKKNVIHLNNDLKKYYMKAELLNNDLPPSLKLTREELQLVKQFIKEYTRLFHELNTNLGTEQIILCFILLTTELFGKKYWDFRIKVCKRYKINGKNYKRFLTNLLRLKLYSSPIKPIEIGESELNKC